MYHICKQDASEIRNHNVNWFIEKIIKILSDALLSIFHFPGPWGGGLARIPILPATLAQLSQSPGMSGSSVTGAMLHNVTMTIDHLHNVTMLSFCHRDHFAMLHCINTM